MTDYGSALGGLNAPKRLKVELPIPFVFEKLGWNPEVIDGRVVCICPWHEDRTPSLWTIELETGWRFGCWTCNFSGDVFDLFSRVWGMGFTEAITTAERALAMCRSEGWKPPVVSEQKVFDPAWARLILREAQRDGYGVEQFIKVKGYAFDTDWLTTCFDVGAFQGELIVPVTDAGGSLIGMKHRRLDGTDKLFSYPGSKLQDALYAEEHLRPGPTVLCEGESDVWVATHSLQGSEYTVLGTAAGAGQPPRPAARLAGREVHIVFDGDDAGRMGAHRWADELGRVGCAVTVWALPEGQDVASLGGISWLPVR